MKGEEESNTLGEKREDGEERSYPPPTSASLSLPTLGTPQSSSGRAVHNNTQRAVWVGGESEGPGERGPNGLSDASEEVLVSEPGIRRLSNATLSFLKSLQLPERFPSPPSEVVSSQQWEMREKWLARNLFERMTAQEEERVESWFDTVAGIVTYYSLSPQLFHYLVERSLSPLDAELWRRAMVGVGYEGKVDLFLKEKFPISMYASELEAALFLPTRKASVRLARDCFYNRITRYVRSAARVDRTVLLSQERVREMACGLLPALVEQHMDLSAVEAPSGKEIPQFWSFVSALEAKLAKHGMLSGPAAVTDVDSLESLALAADVGNGYGEGTVPSTPCGACGGLHWMRDCPHKTTRCEKCHRLGHIEHACKATVLKTSDGRVEVFVLPRPGSIEFKAYKDRTKHDRLTTATNVLKEIVGDMEGKRDRDREKRIEKKPHQKKKRKHPSATPAVSFSTSAENGGPPVALPVVNWASALPGVVSPGSSV